MENKIEVGQKYKWLSEPFDIATITKVEGDKFYYECSSDGYKSDAKIGQDNSIFNPSNLVKEEEPITDNVVNPAHYNSTKITPFQVIDDWNLDFYLGNVIKYICRKGKKDNALEDLKKAQEYLKITVEKLEGVDLENKDK